jgi:hypothetical protein
MDSRRYIKPIAIGANYLNYFILGVLGVKLL